MSFSNQDHKVIGAELFLPCGKAAPNRLAKAPMEEFLADGKNNLPNEKHFEIYRLWTKGGWGLIFTGNIQIDNRRLGLPFDLALPKAPHRSFEVLHAYTRLAESIKGNSDSTAMKPLAIAQLCHTGRQSMHFFGRAIFARPLAPSSVPMNVFHHPILSFMNLLLFGRPKALTKADIQMIVGAFVAAASLMKEAGFDGVELHASHGYLLSSFLSPLENQRDDEYGGSNDRRLRILVEILERVRVRVGKNFAVGVKLNSADYIKGGLNEDDALQHVRNLSKSGLVDWIQISGGNYENPMMAAEMKPSSSRREGFFLAFAKKCKEEQSQVQDGRIKPQIIVTGGFRTRHGIAQAIRENDMDACAIGRPAIMLPDLASILLDGAVPSDKAIAPVYTVPRGPQKGAKVLPVGAGWSNMWHNGQMMRLALGKQVDYQAGPLSTLFTLLFMPLLKRNGFAFAYFVTSFFAFMAAWFVLIK